MVLVSPPRQAASQEKPGTSQVEPGFLGAVLNPLFLSTSFQKESQNYVRNQLKLGYNADLFVDQFFFHFWPPFWVSKLSKTSPKTLILHCFLQYICNIRPQSVDSRIRALLDSILVSKSLRIFFQKWYENQLKLGSKNDPQN